MVRGDVFTSPIDFALQEMIKKYENTKEKHEKIIYEGLIRSRKVWENIRINGLEIYGLTYEQFCEKCNKKKNIVFLTDEELEDFNKAVKIIEILNS